jgi:GDPmannose 4,6-dehydratase
MLNKKTPTDYIIATGHVQSLKQLAMQIFNELDLDWSKYVKHQSVIVLKKNDPEEIFGDTELAINELGWEAKCKGDLLANQLFEEEISYNNLRNQMIKDL